MNFIIKFVLMSLLLLVCNLLPCSGEILNANEIHIVGAAVDDFAREVNRYHDNAIKILSEEAKAKIAECAVVEEFCRLLLKKPELVDDKYFQLSTEKLAICFEYLAKTIACSGDQITGDDATLIMKEAFWHKLHKRPYDFKNRITELVIYWRENRTPDVKISPLGMGKIEWIWKLNVNSRVNGVMHVGMDTIKRTFICYEYGVGAYFPEGETLERIYREIVQEPDMARDHIGKNRIK